MRLHFQEIALDQHRLLNGGLTLQEILKAGGWPSAQTFVKY